MIIVETEVSEDTLAEITALAFDCGTDAVRQVKRSNMRDAVTAGFVQHEDAMQFKAALSMRFPRFDSWLFNS